MNCKAFTQSLGLLGLVFLIQSPAWAGQKIVLKSGPNGLLSPSAQIAPGTNISGAVEELKPVRYSKGTFQVVRQTIDFDPNTGANNFKDVPICTRNTTVGVYDGRGASKNYWLNPDMLECTDTYNGQKTTVKTSGVLLYANYSPLIGDPPQDLKSFNAFSFAVPDGNPKTDVGSIPYQLTFTKDLQQKNFATIAYPPQGIVCTGPDPKDCSVIDPVAYRVVWQVEDQP